MLDHWPVDAILDYTVKLAAGQGLSGLGSSIKRPETMPGSNSAGGGCSCESLQGLADAGGRLNPTGPPPLISIEIAGVAI